MAETSSQKLFLKVIALALLSLAILAGFYFMSGKDPAQAPEEVLSSHQTTDGKQTGEDSVILDSGINVEEAKIERTIGNLSAPIKIVEHASLTCSHCATFHLNTLPEVIKNYVETGKAYIVFSDFPLNAPALHGTMISRCLPQDQHSAFIKNLFETQATWAGEAHYLDLLKQKAASFGMSEEKFNACIGSKELENSIVERIKAVQEQWKITSTPSFVINNQVVISGALPYAEFDKKVQEALAEIEKNSSGSSNESTQPSPPLPVDGQ